MDRSFAARAPVSRDRRTRSRSGSSPAAPSARRWSIRRLPALALSAIAARRRVRIAAICLIVAVPLLGGGWLWLRHSSLVAVEHIRITGVHGPQAHAIESALRDAAKGMSTLDAKPSTLEAAVARFPAVSAVRAIPSFPHSLRIEVTQQPAVAALLVGGIRAAVSGGGVVLGQSLPASSLPTVADDAVPGPGSRLRNVLVLQALSVLAAAPAALDHLAAKAYFGPRGLTVEMRNGLVVLFGDAMRPHAKWLSLASVLADKSSAGATYVDVRLPGRPAAGFPPGAGPGRPEESATGESLQGKSESTVAALAAGLAAANPETKKRQSEEAAKEAEGTKAAHSTEGSGEAEAAGTEAGEAGAEPSG
jgi:cell division protein FtsQ